MRERQGMEIRGKSIVRGIAIGRLALYEDKKCPINKSVITDVAAECVRFRQATAKVREELIKLSVDAAQKVGSKNASIFEAQSMLAEDPDFAEMVENKIMTDGVNSESAIATAAEEFIRKLRAGEDELVSARTDDLREVVKYLNLALLNEDDSSVTDVCITRKPLILLADEILPADLMKLKEGSLCALVTRRGTACSHTAILAASMGIPTLMEADFPKDCEGRMGIVDACEGKLIIEPDESMLKEYMDKKNTSEQKSVLANVARGVQSATPQTPKAAPIICRGREIRLYANIEDAGQVSEVLKVGAEGIGLFRSEFMYMKAADWPTEEELFEAYKAVALAMEGREVVIRTLDIGSDKQAGYMQLPPQTNPALGLRGIRVSLSEPEIFITQLRAILRAAYFGNVSIMFPMIISVSEIRCIRDILNKVRTMLDNEGIPYGDVRLGVMIETPAAVMISDELAGEVDFLSVGSNDLTQYTLGIDRESACLADFYDAYHPAVLRMLKLTVENGHKYGCRVGICGELGADASFTQNLIEMGFDEISVSPGHLADIRNELEKLV